MGCPVAWEGDGGDVGDDLADPRFRPRRRAALGGTSDPTEFLLGAHAAHKF